MTDTKHECAALAVIGPIEQHATHPDAPSFGFADGYMNGQLFCEHRIIESGPFYTHEQVAEMVKAAYREGAKEFASEINGWPGAICSAWHHSQAKAGLKE